MTSVMNISIAKDFTPTPAGRYRTDGRFSGQAFREDKLFPALQANDMVVIDFDGVEGLPSSFLEEVFGGLVRIHGLSPASVLKKLELTATEGDLQIYIKQAREFLEDAGSA